MAKPKSIRQREYNRLWQARMRQDPLWRLARNLQIKCLKAGVRIGMAQAKSIVSPKIARSESNSR